MGSRSAKLEQRPFSIATTSARTWGVCHRGLNAALVGAVSTARARFADPLTATTRRLASNQDAASLATADPWIVVTTADQGTTFQAIRPGLWWVDIQSALLTAAGATRVLAALAVDAAAADLLVATTPLFRDGSRIIDIADVQAVAGAGGQVPIRLSGPVIIPEGARPTVSMLLSNGAGGAVVAGTVNLTGTSINFTWLRDRA